MSIPAAHRIPRPLTQGQGVQGMSSHRAYYRALNKPLAVGGSFLLIAALVAQLLPPTVRSSNVFNGLLAGSLGLFSLVGLLFLRNKFRISFTAFILAMIQIWIVVTVFIGPTVFGLELKLGRNIWWPLFVLMPYMAAFVLVALDVRWRERMLRFMLGVCVFTAFVALLQFLKFPGTFYLSTLYTDLEGLKAFGLDKRSHGLSTHPFHLSAQCILGCGIVASKLLFRKLKVLEILYYAILSSGLVVAQARSFYVVWALITIITVVMLFRRHPVQGISILCIMGALIGGVIVAFPKQMSYGLSGKNTIVEGRQAQWMRADYLSGEYPVTGIGPKETVFGSGTDLSGGGRWWSLYTESGYRMSRVSGGFVGLGLVLLLVLSTLYLSFRVFRDPNAEPMRRRAAFAGFYFTIAIGIGMYITNIVENELITYYGMALAGLVAPQMSEVFKGQMGRTSKYLKRFAQARERLPVKTEPA